MYFQLSFEKDQSLSLFAGKAGVLHRHWIHPRAKSKMFENCDKTDLQQGCVNFIKTNFTTKKHEFYTYGAILQIIRMPDVEKFHFFPHLSYDEI